MKVRNILILLVLFFGLIGSNCFVKGQDRDDFGKLSMWIVDPISGNPVNEVFLIDFFGCTGTEATVDFFKHAKTDERGYLSLKMKTGEYCFHIEPKSFNSKYCIEPFHVHNDQFIFSIMIEKGKITEIIKKATFGGALKIRVFDTSGKIVIPSSDLPEGAEIHVSIDSTNYIIGTLSRRVNNDNMDDGETIVRSLFPSTYNIWVHFDQTGYKAFKFKNILVKEKEVTEVDCVIDLNDITGIEGRILDKIGTPLEGIKVIMLNELFYTGDSYDITDENGYFRITGLPEGSYEIMTTSVSGNMRTATVKVEIKKNILIKKELQIE